MEPKKKELKSNARTAQKMFLTLLFFLSTSYFYGSFFKGLYESLVSLAIPVLVVFFYLFLLRNPRVDKKNFLLFFVFITITSISFFLTEGGLGSVVNNISMAIYLVIFYSVSVNEAEIDFFEKLLTIFHFFFCGFVLIVQYKNGHIGDYNANSVAVQAAINVFLFNLYHTKRKLLWVLQNITGIFIIVYCRSRSVLVALIFFVVMMLFNKKLKTSFLKFAYWVMMLLGIAGPIVLAAMYNNRGSTFVSYLVDLSDKYFGKDFFTGRELMWSNALIHLFDGIPNFLFGIGTNYAENTIDGNYHSSFFTICICCGILGYITISLLLYRFYAKGLKEDSYNSKKCCIAYLSMMVISLFESILFSGHFSFLAYIILVIANTQPNREELSSG